MPQVECKPDSFAQNNRINMSLEMRGLVLLSFAKSQGEIAVGPSPSHQCEEEVRNHFLTESIEVLLVRRRLNKLSSGLSHHPLSSLVARSTSPGPRTWTVNQAPAQRFSRSASPAIRVISVRFALGSSSETFRERIYEWPWWRSQVAELVASDADHTRV